VVAHPRGRATTPVITAVESAEVDTDDVLDLGTEEQERAHGGEGDHAEHDAVLRHRLALLTRGARLKVGIQIEKHVLVTSLLWIDARTNARRGIAENWEVNLLRVSRFFEVR
jgi:hypothetical protein